MFFKKYCFFLIIFQIALLPCFAQDSNVIRVIEIEGNNRIAADDLVKVLPFKVGDTVTQREPAELLTKINSVFEEFGCLAFEIRYDREGITDGVKLIILIQENLQLSEYNISGNTHFTDAEIKKFLPYKIADRLPIDATAHIKRKLQNEYSLEGFGRTKFTVDQTPDPDSENWVIIKIDIAESGRLKIKKVILKGNEAFGKLRLKTILTTKDSYWIAKSYYSESEFEDDLQLLGTLYRSKGYLDVKVSRGEFIFGKDKSWVNPVIEIDEGQRFNLQSVNFTGNLIFGTGVLRETFIPLEGKPFDGSKLNSATEAIRRLYGDSGYIDAQVSTEEDIDYENRQVNLIVKIEENKRVNIRNVAVMRKQYKTSIEWEWLNKLVNKVSPPVKDEVVLREVEMQPGQVLRTFEQLQAERRLKRMGIFRDVKVVPVVTENPRERDVEVQIQESGSGSFVRFGIAFNDESGAAVFASYTERNLFGDANYLSLDFFIGSESQRVKISYQKRHHVLKNKLLLKLGLLEHEDVRKRYDLYLYEIDRDAYEEEHIGGAITYTENFDDEFRSESIRFRVEDVSLDRDNDEISDDFDESYIVASIRKGWGFDNTDDTFFPSEGKKHNLFLELGTADGFLAKLTGKAQSFKSWNNPKWVWASIFKGGLLPYDADTIGVSERLFLGGDSDMRGFITRGAGPKDPADDDAALGGATKLLLQNELRYRFTEDLYANMFVDVGTLGEDLLDIGDPRLSVGTGIHIRMNRPRIFIQLQLAQSLIDESEDETRFVHFRLGTN